MKPEEKRIRILQINPHFSSFTSTGKQVIGLDAVYKNHFDSFIAYSQKEGAHVGGFYYGSSFDKILSAALTRVFGNRYGRGNLTTTKLIRLVKTLKPDIVHAHCINNYDVNVHRFFGFLRKRGLPFIVTEHAEFFHTGNCSHAFECKQYIEGCRHCPNKFFATKSRLFGRTLPSWKRMKASFNGYNRCVAVSVSPWLASRASLSHILEGIPVRCIFNGIDTSVFHYKPTEIKKQILYVTSNATTSNKGLHHLLAVAAALPAYEFTVIGNVPEKVQISFENSNVRFVGPINEQKTMADYYRQSFVTLTLSKVETFGMTVAESLCCGTPVIGFRSGGPESIALQNASAFCAYGDITAVVKTITAFEQNNLDRPKIAEEAAKAYSFETIGQQYVQLVNELIGQTLPKPRKAR